MLSVEQQQSNTLTIHHEKEQELRSQVKPKQQTAQKYKNIYLNKRSKGHYTLHLSTIVAILIDEWS